MGHEPRKMVEKLRTYGKEYGLATLGTAIVVVGPGEPFSVYATWFTEADLRTAIDAGLLEERKLSGSFELTIYAARQG
jgi:hypothetical protein